jgi:hypothetical protein
MIRSLPIPRLVLNQISQRRAPLPLLIAYLEVIPRLTLRQFVVPRRLQYEFLNVRHA